MRTLTLTLTLTLALTLTLTLALSAGQDADAVLGKLDALAARMESMQAQRIGCHTPSPLRQQPAFSDATILIDNCLYRQHQPAQFDS